MLSCNFLTFLGRQRSPHNILTDIIFFAEIEQLADLAGSLGSKATGDGCVSQTRDVILTYKHSHKSSDTALITSNKCDIGKMITNSPAHLLSFRDLYVCTYLPYDSLFSRG